MSTDNGIMIDASGLFTDNEIYLKNEFGVNFNPLYGYLKHIVHIGDGHIALLILRYCELYLHRLDSSEKLRLEH